MSVFLQPIYTQTVGAGGQFGITFNNIPQTFTDLVLQISARNVSAVTTIDMYIGAINGDSGTNYSSTYLFANGSSVASGRGSNATVVTIGQVPGASATSNTFGSATVTIPNYTSSNYKQIISDCVTENNATAVNTWMSANLWRGTAAISYFTVYLSGGSNLSQYTDISLYGVLRQGI